MTFVATANCVGHAGGCARFADICSLEDLNISPEDIERRITPRTKAVIIVHYGGFPCQMDAIQDICQRHALALIEDACHTPGANYAGRSLGTWGDIGCYSFFSNKNLATGEGGMLVTDRDDIAEKVSLLRSHAMTTLTWDRHNGRAYSYDVVDLGYNYRIDEIRSALGLAQLHKLVEGNHRREEITCQYWQAFTDTSLTLPFAHFVEKNLSKNPKSSFHLFPVLLPEGANRETFMASLKEQGVQSSIHYPPIHAFSYYRKLEPDLHLPTTEEAAARQVTLPLYPSMTAEQVETVIKAVKVAL
jgi:dTDP-4-amino-4,6-dideoxygalactose transaminase